MKEKWLDQIREKVENHSSEPPKELWEELEQSLLRDSEWPVTSDRKPKRNRRVPLLWAASLAGIGLVTLAVYFFRPDAIDPAQKSPTIANHQSSRPSNAITPVTGEDSKEGSALDTGNTRSSLEVESTSAMANISKDKASFWSVGETNVPDTSLERMALVFTRPLGVLLVSSPPLPSLPPVKEPKVHYIASTQGDRTAHEAKKNWAIGPVLGQSSGGTDFQYPGYYSMSGAALPSVALLEAEGAYSQVFAANLDREVETRVSHKMPINLGLGLSIPLEGRWSLNTGLTYSQLNSRLQSGTKESHWQTQQKLNYVGVPVQVNYQVTKGKKVSTYAFAGAEVKKMVGGSQSTEYTVNKESAQVKKVKVNEKPFQVSTRAGVGIEVPLYKNVNFFIEPAMEYHLDDKSSLQTIYKESPTNFTLKGGLRISLDSK